MPALKPAGKAVLIGLAVIALIVGGNWIIKNGFAEKILPKGKANVGVSKVTKVEGKKPIRVCVNTWGGFAGGEYFNKGFKASTDSRYFTEYGVPVEFVLIDDFDAARAAWKAGQVDLLWQTADAFPNEASSLSSFSPRVVFQADWSDGGDVALGTRDIQSVEDLKGRTVALALGTPSHSLLLWSLNASGIGYDDVKIVECKTAIEAASIFKAGKVDAAVVWSPDDQDCLAAVPGSHVLTSSKTARIIADVFYAKKEFVDSHPEELHALIEGWFKGAAEINTNPQAFEDAAQILAAGLNQPVDFCKTAIKNTRLCTYGDNVNFFNLQGTYGGVKGEDLYSKTARLYQAIGYLRDEPPPWRMVTETSILRGISLTGSDQAAWGEAKFAQATPEEAQAPAFSTKRLTVNFPTNSAVLDATARTIIDHDFVDIAKNFNRYRIRIEGNTDNTGTDELNRRLSKARAQAVAAYLIETYRFDPDRFTVRGNGWDEQVASNDSDEGRAKNRRTDFELLNTTY